MVIFCSLLNPSSGKETRAFFAVRSAPGVCSFVMISKEVVISNSVGLHARPATYFIQKANTFRCSIWIECGDRRANAKSLLGVLSLGISKGANILLIADGIDESDALEALANLILTGFND